MKKKLLTSKSNHQIDVEAKKYCLNGSNALLVSSESTNIMQLFSFFFILFCFDLIFKKRGILQLVCAFSHSKYVRN